MQQPDTTNMHNYKQGKCVAVFPCSKSKTYNIVQNSKKQREHGEEYPKNFGCVFTALHYINYLTQWYSTFFVRVPPDIISLQLFTPKVVGV
jgi:hypothetical protein